MLLVTDNLRATVLATVLARLRFSPAAAAPGVDRGAMEGMLVMLILFLENMFRCLVVVVFYGIWHEICVKRDEIMSLLVLELSARCQKCQQGGTTGQPRTARKGLKNHKTRATSPISNLEAGFTFDLIVILLRSRTASLCVQRHLHSADTTAESNYAAEESGNRRNSRKRATSPQCLSR